MLGILGSVLGSAASGIAGLFGQSSANDANKEAATHQYRWGVSDMKAAGLNPAAMYAGKFNPAPLPGTQNEMAAPAAALKDAAGSATQVMVANKTIESLTSQIAKQNAEKANIAAALPGISADAGRKDMEFGDIKKIPPSVRIPIVQSGYGVDKLRGAGQIPALGAGAAASAKSAASGIGDALAPLGGLSGPTLSSARSVSSAFKDKAPALGAALKRWWEREFPYIEPKYRKGAGSTHYKQ